jgi:hypothetical protein
MLLRRNIDHLQAEIFLLVGTPVFAVKTYKEGRVWNGHVRLEREHVKSLPRSFAVFLGKPITAGLFSYLFLLLLVAYGLWSIHKVHRPRSGQAFS